MEEELSAEQRRHLFCEFHEASYGDRVYNEEQRNFCSVPEKGFDAVLFVAIGVIATCLAPRKHYAIVMLVLGALLQLLNIEVNIRELSNALNVWIGITPAKLFFYIFLPPLLLDSAVRIDFFVFKKVMSQVFVFAFGVVACNTVLLAVFMLYVMNLRDEGWEWTDAFLFACMIASTDALAVTAIMKDGAGPEHLIILAEGESLFNDATSIVFFDLFWPRFKDSVAGELEHEAVMKVVGDMALDVLWLASGGALIGIGAGILTIVLFRWLQNRHGHSPISEVGITLGVSYLAYYIAESLVEVSGVIAVVVYGLFGAATTQWDISPAARESKVFSGFWDVTQLLVNGIVFFYAGASATNFFYRCEEDLFDGPDEDAWTTILAWMPGVYFGIFLLRFLEIALVAPIVGFFFGFKLKINEVVFISLAGLRGALALILAQELLQYEFPEDPNDDFEQEQKVRAQSALWVCGFVLLTLMINAPGIPFLLKICGLQEQSPVQEKYRKKSEQALLEFTRSTIDDMKGDPALVLRGVNWKLVEAFIFTESSGNRIAEVVGTKQSADVTGVTPGVVDARWQVVRTLSSPSIPSTTGAGKTGGAPEKEAPFGGRFSQPTSVLGQQEEGKKTSPIISTGAGQAPATSGKSNSARTNSVVALSGKGGAILMVEQFADVPNDIVLLMERSQYPAKDKEQKFFASTSAYFNLVKRDCALPSLWQDSSGPSPSEGPSHVAVRPMRASEKSHPMKDSALNVALLEHSGDEDEVSRRNMMLTEARFRMLMGLKKYFQQRRTNGHLSSQALRLLEWACDLNMEEPDAPLSVWDVIADDIKSRFLVKTAFKVRNVLRKTAVELRGWPHYVEAAATPLLTGASKGLSAMLIGDLQVAVESAVEYWIALNVYRTHSSWLVNAQTSQALAEQVREQAQKVWTFILDREIESPDRFEAIQTFRTKRAILYSQVGFVDELSDVGLLEESEHEHLRHALEQKRTQLSRSGPVLQDFEMLDFLKNVPCFANVSYAVFREVISVCQLRMHQSGDLIPATDAGEIESFSFHIIVNGILRSSYTNSLGKTNDYHLGRGGIFGLLTALSGESYPWMGKGYAELNAMGHGPSVLTVPHSALIKIHDNVTKGIRQYQQLELDLFRLAALYILEYTKDELLAVMTAIYLEQGSGQGAKGAGKAAVTEPQASSFARQLDGSPLGASAGTGVSSTTPESVMESHTHALETVQQFKESLLEGELAVVPPNSKFIQSTSSILVIGALTPQKPGAPQFVSPIVLPWLLPDAGVNLEYTSGPQGAVVMCRVSPPGSGASSSQADDSMRIGKDMAAMPSTAARIHNALIT